MNAGGTRRTLRANDVLKYVNAPTPARRAARARELRERTGAYEAAHDFWLPVRSAIQRDRATTRDGSAVRACAREASSRRHDAYTRVAARWNEVLPRWEHSVHESSTVGRVDFDVAAVELRPAFTERRADGRREVVLAWLLTEPLATRTAHGALRLGQKAWPGDVVVVVDVQRAGLVSTEDVDVSGLDDELADEVRRLAATLGA